MSDSILRVDTSLSTPDIHVIVATGEVDLSSSHLITESLPEPRVAEIVLDLTGVTYLDSSGLRILIQCAARSRLQLVAPTRGIPFEVLKLSGIFELVSVHDTLTDALTRAIRET